MPTSKYHAARPVKKPICQAITLRCRYQWKPTSAASTGMTTPPTLLVPATNAAALSTPDMTKEARASRKSSSIGFPVSPVATQLAHELSGTETVRLPKVINQARYAAIGKASTSRKRRRLTSSPSSTPSATRNTRPAPEHISEAMRAADAGTKRPGKGGLPSSNNIASRPKATEPVKPI